MEDAAAARATARRLRDLAGTVAAGGLRFRAVVADTGLLGPLDDRLRERGDLVGTATAGAAADLERAAAMLESAATAMVAEAEAATARRREHDAAHVVPDRLGRR